MSKQQSKLREAMPHKTSYPTKDNKSSTSNHRTPVYWDELENSMYQQRREEQEWREENGWVSFQISL